MEENQKAKVVSMKNTAKKEVKDEGKRATYEELNSYCLQLFNQNKQLVEQLRQKELANLFKRLDYLFLVLRNKDSFNADFVGNCAEEIQGALVMPDAPEEESKENNKQ